MMDRYLKSVIHLRLQSPASIHPLPHSPACLHLLSTVVYDINGRESAEARPVLEGARATLEQYIYCSSAGVYLKSDQMPHRETDATDVKSRHKGKLDTESYLQVQQRGHGF